jgi:hypothetical protein
MPVSGRTSRFAIASSAARAASSAREKSRTQIALILASCRSIRDIASCVSSSAETCFAQSACDSSRAVLNVHSEFATANPSHCRQAVQQRSGCHKVYA